eukprot:2826250-Alexandrium_andersonii.AAC.1
MSRLVVEVPQALLDRATSASAVAAHVHEVQAAIAEPRGVVLDREGIPVSYTHLTLPTICSV